MVNALYEVEQEVAISKLTTLYELINKVYIETIARGSGERLPAKKSIDQRNQLPQKRALRRWSAKNPPANHR